MGQTWRELLSRDVVLNLPWFAGRDLRSRGRRWKIRGPMPTTEGWHQFRVDTGRRATWLGPGTEDLEAMDRAPSMAGYLVGDRLVPDGVSDVTGAGAVFDLSVKVRLSPGGLERFTRARLRSIEGRWIFQREEFPLGPEPELETLFLEGGWGLEAIKGVTPALELVFNLESLRRDRVARQRQRAAERREAAARQRQLARLHSTGVGRRAMARLDFEAAARAALSVSGVKLLDIRPWHSEHERRLRFYHEGLRIECVVDAVTLGVIDAGICLHDHRTGEKGDTYFTLESLPGVITQAARENRLVVY